MQPKPVGRRAKQAHETRELIIRVAQRLFAKQGYASTSIDEVLKGAGVARGASITISATRKICSEKYSRSYCVSRTRR
jgi:hypothetical protein